MGNCIFLLLATGLFAATGAGPSSWIGDLTPITPTPQDVVRHLVYYQKVQDVDMPPFQETGIFPSQRSRYADLSRQEWMGYDDTKSILSGDYAPLGIFG